MKLFYPANRETALNILRSKLRYDLVRRDESGNITCHTNREDARREANELRVQKDEMFLVVIEFDAASTIITADVLGQLERTKANKPTVSLNSGAQTTLSQVANFSLEIVAGTEDWLATYGNRAPECGVGIGPFPS